MLFISECSYDIAFTDGTPSLWRVGGCLAEAAMVLAQGGTSVNLASEISTDAIGDALASRLARAGVNMHSVDRFTEGQSPVCLYLTDTPVRYDDYPAEGFDIVWPRVQPGEVVVFGGCYVLSQARRQRVVSLLEHCREMGAIVVYVPDFRPAHQAPMTRIMPTILDFFEMADLVVSRSADLAQFFRNPAPETCYRNNIAYYCRNLINIDEVAARAEFFFTAGSCSSPIAREKLAHGNAPLIAALALALQALNVKGHDLEDLKASTAQAVLDDSVG